MGDYTNTGIKIGTSGRAYYATLKQLKDNIGNGSEVRWYLDPKNKAQFAFPYPEFDKKKIGDISVFHKKKNELTILEIGNEHKTFHKSIVHHVHPEGGQGVNLFCDCPYHSRENVSSNFNEVTQKFYLMYEGFTNENGERAVIGECIYCGETNVFEHHEAEEAAGRLIEKAIAYEKQTVPQVEKAERLRIISQRILAAYK